MTTDEFPVELGSAYSVAAVSTAEFSVDMRNKGGVGSTGSAEFALDTTTTADGWLEVTAPANVASGSVSPVLVTWHSGSTTRTVTNQVRWAFRTDPAGASWFSGGELHAGQVSTPTSMTVAAVYETIGGISRQSVPVTITVLPGLQGSVTAARQGTTGGVVVYTASVNGAATIRWDTDHDGRFDDGIAPSVTMDYGTATGTFGTSALISDGVSEISRTGSITLNKPPVQNQPVVTLPTVDPAGFELFNGDAANSTFAFDPSRTDNGLVVILHGLYSDAKQPWLRDMANAIERRCDHEGKGRPNIALMDWSDKAGDPFPVPPFQMALINGMIKVSNYFGYKPGSYAGNGFKAADFLADLYGVRELGLQTGQLLASWAYQNSRLTSSHPINADAPIHFIGHSAGGFVCGEAARLLKHPRLATWQPVHVDRVTMLDTPLPPLRLIGLVDDGFPNPGVAEHFASSIYGTIPAWDARNMPSHLWYRPMPVFKSDRPADMLDPGENGHGWSYKWYTDKTTDPLGETLSDGFYLSPIINPSTRISKPYMPPQSAPAPIPPPEGAPQPIPAPEELPDIVPAGWETFGAANDSSGTWTLTESADAGIWKDLNLPATASKLAFDFHFLTAGDGDFLAVHFGDNPVLYQGLDLPLSRDAWLPAEIPLDLLPSLNGKLVFTLVSRGGVNAQVQLRNIRIIQSEDADGDGLAFSDETTAGSNPRIADSDGDGLSDGVEVLQYNTDPLYADSDGDGQNDPAELAAGTNPLQNGSYLRVAAISKTAQGFTLQWTGVAGKSYRVLRSQELGTANHEALAFGVPGSVPFTGFTDPSPPPNKAFYWVEVE